MVTNQPIAMSMDTGDWVGGDDELLSNPPPLKVGQCGG